MGIFEGFIKPIFKTEMMFALFGKVEPITYNGPVYNIYVNNNETAAEIVREIQPISAVQLEDNSIAETEKNIVPEKE